MQTASVFTTLKSNYERLKVLNRSKIVINLIACQHNFHEKNYFTNKNLMRVAYFKLFAKFLNV